MTVLALEQVRFAFPGWPPTVDGADLAVDEGAFHCLVGRSGCGKTTLLKLAAGLLVPNAGRIRFQARNPAAPGRDIGFVFQSPNLLEWKRVIDNVLLPIALHRAPTPEEVARARQLLEQLGLAAHRGLERVARKGAIADLGNGFDRTLAGGLKDENRRHQIARQQE